MAWWAALVACDREPRTFPMWTGDSAGDDTGPTQVSELLTVGFTGSVASVARTPFGFDDTVVTAPVSGFFTYDLTVPDGSPTDVGSGHHDHVRGNAPFLVTIEGRTVAGSGNPVATIDLDGPTFRWNDGIGAVGVVGVSRVCSVDDVPDPSVRVALSIASTVPETLATDALPSPFPWIVADLAATTAITFEVEEVDGSLLLQVDAFTGE